MCWWNGNYTWKRKLSWEIYVHLNPNRHPQTTLSSTKNGTVLVFFHVPKGSENWSPCKVFSQGSRPETAEQDSQLPGQITWWMNAWHSCAAVSLKIVDTKYTDAQFTLMPRENNQSHHSDLLLQTQVYTVLQYQKAEHLVLAFGAHEHRDKLKRFMKCCIVNFSCFQILWHTKLRAQNHFNLSDLCQR